MNSCEVGTPAPSLESYEETLKERENGAAMRVHRATDFRKPLMSDALSLHIHCRMLFTELALA